MSGLLCGTWLKYAHQPLAFTTSNWTATASVAHKTAKQAEKVVLQVSGKFATGRHVGVPTREPALLPRAEGQKLWDGHYSGALLDGGDWSAVSSLQALGNCSYCPLRSVNTSLSPHSPAALPNIPPSRKKTPFGIPLFS